MDWTLARNPAFLDSIRRHFVCLSGTLHDLDGQGQPKGDERHFCCSAFVAEVRGVWCLVTAGHVLEDIDNGIRNKQLRLLKCGFADYFSAAALVKEPTPIPYEDLQRIAVYRGGFDLGAIPLRPLFMQGMHANGVRPIPVAPWQGRSPPRFDGYALLGLPVEGMEPLSRQGDRGPQIGHGVTLMLVGVDALASPPADRVLSPIPRFAGILRDAGELSSVEGMSGGPILGMNRNAAGGLDYACVAIQSAWYRSDRMILGTPMGIVMDAFNKLLDKAAFSPSA